MINKILIMLIVLFSILLFSAPFAKEAHPIGLRLEGYAYPYPVNYINLKIENKSIQMAYMDVPPSGKPQNQTVVLLHGGLAFGAYWKDTIQFLSQHGFRVIVPDQIGFGKSSKENIHYNFNMLAKNTNTLLQHLGINNVIFVGHSLGGMLAIRFTLMYPEKVSKLVLEDPLGLEDYRLKIPFKSIDEIIQLHPTQESILKTHTVLYANWNEKYADYANVSYQVSLNTHYSKVALVQALIYEMIYLEPVMYELQNIKIPTLFIYGDNDRTAPGKLFASDVNQKSLGNFPILVKNAAEQMPQAEVVELKNVGHIPHLEASQQFNAKILHFFLTNTWKMKYASS